VERAVVTLNTKDDANTIYYTVHCAYCNEPLDSYLDEFGCLRRIHVDTTHECELTWEDTQEEE
jgi:hypothetical protein